MSGSGTGGRCSSPTGRTSPCPTRRRTRRATPSRRRNSRGSSERARCEKVACLYFNGWLFEGYDDAKSAILTAVLLALGEHKRFGAKVRGKVVSLLKSVNWMRVARLGFKHVAVPTIAAYASGGATLVPGFLGTVASWFGWGKKEEADGKESEKKSEKSEVDPIV
jgi:hypothetical protein